MACPCLSRFFARPCPIRPTPIKPSFLCQTCSFVSWFCSISLHTGGVLDQACCAAHQDATVPSAHAHVRTVSPFFSQCHAEPAAAAYCNSWPGSVAIRVAGNEGAPVGAISKRQRVELIGCGRALLFEAFELAFANHVHRRCRRSGCARKRTT